ncbi:hypothetical protein [Streptomyces sp. NPDC000880]
MTSVMGLLEARERAAQVRVEELREDVERVLTDLRAAEAVLERRVVARVEPAEALAGTESEYRSVAYAEAARLGAPDAVHVADRWHIWRNLVAAVETVIQHRALLRKPEEAGPVRSVAHSGPLTHALGLRALLPDFRGKN